METSHEERRLSAIMFTDIVGYTKKMGDDEVKMLRLLKDHERLVKTAVEANLGEVIKGTGDGFLVRFDSATNTVPCAISIQQALTEYNTDKPAPDQITVRIGIHLGDIVLREGDVFGDGVNVAARVQPLAQPGGICITRAIYDMVRKKMEIKAVELGPQQLKHVDEAVEVFHLLTGTLGVKDVRKSNLRRKPKRVKTALAVSVSVILISILAVTLIIRYGLRRQETLVEWVAQTASVKVPENKVAVLPLRNLTGKEDDQYLAEGFSQDMVYRLAASKDIYVYPMDEVRALDEKSRTYSGVRKELGAKYGSSLFRVGNKIFNARSELTRQRRVFATLPKASEAISRGFLDSLPCCAS